MAAALFLVDTAALFLVDRRPAVAAPAKALLVAASLVYAGAHHPHDVVVGLAVGAVVGVAASWAARTFAGPFVSRLR